jgi:hypothetical protein
MHYWAVAMLLRRLVKQARRDNDLAAWRMKPA